MDADAVGNGSEAAERLSLDVDLESLEVRSRLDE
jgi:hypothetical protein